MQRSEKPGLLIIIVVALRPHRLRQRRVLAIPGAAILFRSKLAFHSIRAAVAKSLIEPADAVVHGGDEHQVSRGPRIKIPMRKNAGHAEARHIGDVAPAKDLPFVGQDRIDPGVERPVARSVVVEIRNRFVQIVQHLRLPADESVQDVLRQLQAYGHGVAVVVMRHVLAPIHQRRVIVVGMSQVPVIEVHHTVAAVNFDDGSDQRDNAVANGLNILALVDSQPIRQLHQRRGRARFPENEWFR